MHYYSFNIGDYASHTRHLEPLEDLAYRRILDMYYLHEQPLNECSTTVARLINMRKNVKEVELVLNEFFLLVKGVGWTNPRADAEIAKFHSKLESASKAGKASAQRRANNRSTDVQLNKKQEPRTSNQEPEKTNTTTAAVAAVSVPKKSAAVPDQNFERFWEAYDYKLSRHKALKAWQSINPDDELAEKIIAAALIYNKANPGRAYYKHATTWLNGRNWEDNPNDLLPKIARMHEPAKTQHQLNQEAVARSLGLIPSGAMKTIQGEVIDATENTTRLLG